MRHRNTCTIVTGLRDNPTQKSASSGPALSSSESSELSFPRRQEQANTKNAATTMNGFCQIHSVCAIIVNNNELQFIVPRRTELFMSFSSKYDVFAHCKNCSGLDVSMNKFLQKQPLHLEAMEDLRFPSHSLALCHGRDNTSADFGVWLL